MTTLNEYGERVDTGAVYARSYLANISGIVKFLKTTKAKEEGVDLQEFARAGHIPPMAVVQELRRRGYEIEVFEKTRKGLSATNKVIDEAYARCCRLLAVPAVGARKRKEDQVQLFDPGPRERRQTTPYEDTA